MTLLLIWAAGTLVLLARLLVDLQRGRTLLHESVSADSSSDQVRRQVAARLHIVSPPRVVVNPFLSSPCLLGHWRPVILLPEEIEPASYDQVLLHELAHLRRSDWLWTIIGRMAQSILWCQPLVWRLHRQHMSVAEEICDDYVIEYGCNRESYLQQLIQIAEMSLPQTRPIGVSMVGFRSKLGRRTARILDTTRVVSTQVGRYFVANALLTALMTTAGVALVEIGHAEPTITTNADDPMASVATDNDIETDNSKAEANAESKQPANMARTYTGKVTGPDGAPLADVTISANNITFNREESRHNAKAMTTTKTAADGSYSIHFQPKDGYNEILAQISGFGPDVVQLEGCGMVSGRVLSQDSEPVVNMEVHITPVQEPSQDNWARDLGPVVTDAAGQFEMRLPLGGLYRLWSSTSMGPNFGVWIRPTGDAIYKLGDLKDAMDLKEETTEKLKQRF